VGAQSACANHYLLSDLAFGGTKNGKRHGAPSRGIQQAARRLILRNEYAIEPEDQISRQNLGVIGGEPRRTPSPISFIRAK